MPSEDGPGTNGAVAPTEPRLAWSGQSRRFSAALTSRSTSSPATAHTLEAVEVVYRMFSRWRDESYFRYSRTHFALDALHSYRVQDGDPERSVPNPTKVKLRRKLRRARVRLIEAEAAYGQAAEGTPEARRANMRGFKIANADLRQQLLADRENLRVLEAQSRGVQQKWRRRQPPVAWPKDSEFVALRVTRHVTSGPCATSALVAPSSSAVPPRGRDRGD